MQIAASIDTLGRPPLRNSGPHHARFMRASCAPCHLKFRPVKSRFRRTKTEAPLSMVFFVFMRAPSGTAVGHLMLAHDNRSHHLSCRTGSAYVARHSHLECKMAELLSVTYRKPLPKGSARWDSAAVPAHLPASMWGGSSLPPPHPSG